LPYLICPACHVQTYSAAVRFGTPGPCPNCDAPLPAPRLAATYVPTADEPSHRAEDEHAA
jgi:RNA polymerase-binding transcription factor DksA